MLGGWVGKRERLIFNCFLAALQTGFFVIRFSIVTTVARRYRSFFLSFFVKVAILPTSHPPGPLYTKPAVETFGFGNVQVVKTCARMTSLFFT